MLFHTSLRSCQTGSSLRANQPNKSKIKSSNFLELKLDGYTEDITSRLFEPIQGRNSILYNYDGNI